MSTKPEQHDVVRAFAKSLKPPFRLSLPALETLAVVAYKQPVTVPEISEIRGVDSGGVIATLLDRKLILLLAERPSSAVRFSTRPVRNFFCVLDSRMFMNCRAWKSSKKCSPSLS